MSTRTVALRELAQALEDAETAQAWLRRYATPAHTDSFLVTPLQASAVTGYDSARKALTLALQERIREIVDRAHEILEERVEKAEEKLRNAETN